LRKIPTLSLLMQNSRDESRSREAHDPPSASSRSALYRRSVSRFFRVALDTILHFNSRTKLRSKFLLSLALVTIALMAGTLLSVRQSLQAQAQRQLEQDAQKALLTFQVMAQQQRLVLSHKAELLAALASMRGGNATALRDAIEDPWQSDDCELFA